MMFYNGLHQIKPITDIRQWENQNRTCIVGSHSRSVAPPLKHLHLVLLNQCSLPIFGMDHLGDIWVAYFGLTDSSVRSEKLKLISWIYIYIQKSELYGLIFFRSANSADLQGGGDIRK